MAPRSLAEAVRERSDEELAALLQARPDLLHPMPSDFTALAARSTTGPSVSRCLDALSALELFILSVAARLTAADAASARDIQRGVADAIPDISSDVVEASLDRLRKLAMVWGTDDSLRAIHPVRDALGEIDVPVWPEPELSWSNLADISTIDAQAGVHAHDSIAHVRDLCEAWAIAPPGVMRSGGLSLRDFALTTKTLNADLATTALAVETAAAAGLLADDEEEQPAWVPTDTFDPWLDSGAARQWGVLARAWLGLQRLPSQATERTNILSADQDRRAVAGHRHAVLSLLSQAPEGAMVSAESVRAVLDARNPRRAGSLRNDVISATLAEGNALGLLVGGALSTAGRRLLVGDEKAALKAMESSMPPEIDHVLIQADLTVIAPGPVIPSVGRTLRLLADVESRGHATVFRVSESSIQRAIDAGWDAAKITRELDAISTTGVPQPLAYLIDDTARRHGVVRVGIASAYVRCDNEATLSAIMNDRRFRALELTRIGGDVIASQATSGELIDALRAAGYAPAAESPDGSVVVRQPHARRAPARRHQRVRTTQSNSRTVIDSAIRALRSGERAAAAPRGAMVTGPAGDRGVQPTSSGATVAALRRALADTEPLWIAYADTDGTTSEQIIDPIRLGGGTLTAYDHRTERVRTFTVARISGVAPLSGEGV